MNHLRNRTRTGAKWPYWTGLGLGLGVLALTVVHAQAKAILPGVPPSQAVRVSSTLLAQQQQPKTALVIGNADYGGADDLEAPDDDAQAMYEKLQELGFDVPPPLLNATKQEMEQALRDFAQRMEEGGINVFYYSGHGVQIDGENYLLPVGLDEPSSEVYVRYNAVPLEYVVAEMFNVVHDFNFLIVDACRNNPFYSRWGRPKGPDSQGLASIPDLPRGTMIAYATQANEVAVDSTGADYSPFTASLLKYLDVPDLNIFEMLTRVTADVESQTDGEQVPFWEGNPREILALNPATTPIPQRDSPVQPSEPVTESGPVIQTPTESTQTNEPTLISATTGVNYQPLQEALTAGDFELADNITNELIVRVASRGSDRSNLRIGDVQNFPCEDLGFINQLWLDSSNGKFGFSVQQQIYQGLGGTPGEFDADIWQSFGDEVGWRPFSYQIEPTNAPEGHLPYIVIGALALADFVWPDFLWKSVECNTQRS